MKFHAISLSALAFVFAVPAIAQTSHVARRVRPITARPACADTQPATPAGVPAATGCAKPLYALRYLDIKEGTGDPVPDSAWVTVNYTGWLASDGSKFDSSVDRNEPFSFHLPGRVIPGWNTGFAGMKVGGKRRLFIPYQLAYGDRSPGKEIPPKSDLIFDIELLSVSDAPPAPKPPAAAPDAQTTAPAQNSTPAQK